MGLVAVAGVGAIVAGIFPEDVNQDLHILGALLVVPMSNVGMALLALAVRRRHRGLAVFTGVAQGDVRTGTSVEQVERCTHLLQPVADSLHVQHHRHVEQLGDIPPGRDAGVDVTDQPGRGRTPPQPVDTGGR